MRGITSALALVMALALAGPTGAAAAMTLSSPDIRPGGPIGPAHTYPQCGGRNLSPRLTWSGAPPGTRSLALTMIDEDVRPAGFAHWIVVDLPPTATALPGGLKTPPGPARALTGDFGDAAYDGPCPPRGSGPHHYRFTVWALPTATAGLPAGVTARAIETILARRALASASFTGVAER